MDPSPDTNGGWQLIHRYGSGRGWPTGQWHASLEGGPFQCLPLTYQTWAQYYRSEQPLLPLRPLHWDTKSMETACITNSNPSTSHSDLHHYTRFYCSRSPTSTPLCGMYTVSLGNGGHCAKTSSLVSGKIRTNLGIQQYKDLVYKYNRL